jgi:hypothetical protein
MEITMQLAVLFAATAFSVGSLPMSVQAADARWVSPYNIVWNSPSKDSLDSMPLSGRLGTGANVWVQDGSLWLYVAHNAAYD